MKFIKALKVNNLSENDKIEVGDKIRIYGKETTVTGFYVCYNDGLEKWETIILTDGRGDPFERSIDVIDVQDDWPPVKSPPVPPVPAGINEEAGDAFVQKHLKNIREKLLEIFIQEKVRHLSRPPMDASVKYFLETGTINGNFLLSIKDIVYGLPVLIQQELGKPLPASIVQKLREGNPYQNHPIHSHWDSWTECCDTLEQLIGKQGEGKEIEVIELLKECRVIFNWLDNIGGKGLREQEEMKKMINKIDALSIK